MQGKSREKSLAGKGNPEHSRLWGQVTPAAELLMPQGPESLTREDAGTLSVQPARRLVLGPGRRLVEDQGSGGDKGMV